MTEATPPDYPTAWAIDAVLADGGTVHVRPIAPDDAQRIVHSSAPSPRKACTSASSVRGRSSSDAEVARFTTVDYHDRMAFVAFLAQEMIAVGRYDRSRAATRPRSRLRSRMSTRAAGSVTLILEYLASYAAEKGSPVSPPTR